MKLFAILTFVSAFLVGLVVAYRGNIGSGEMTQANLFWLESRGRFNSIKKGTEKRTQKGTENPFAKNICMNSLDWVE